MTQMNLSTKQKQTHRHREQPVVAKGRGPGKGGSSAGHLCPLNKDFQNVETIDPWELTEGDSPKLNICKHLF